MLTHDQIEAVNNLQFHLQKLGDTAGTALLQKVLDLDYYAARSKEQMEHIAIWAADCEAATAEGYASRKSASRGERTRHAAICKSLREMLTNGVYTKSDGFQPFETVKARVLERLDKAESKCIEANV